MENINPVKLSQIINDIWDGVERSKVGSIYILNESGEIVKTPEGCAVCSTAALNVFNMTFARAIQDREEI